MAIFKAVTASYLVCGCTGITRGTRSWWWELELECGHHEERYVPSRLAKNETAVAPKRVRCGYCECINKKEKIDVL